MNRWKSFKRRCRAFYYTHQWIRILRVIVELALGFAIFYCFLWIACAAGGEI